MNATFYETHLKRNKAQDTPGRKKLAVLVRYIRACVMNWEEDKYELRFSGEAPKPKDPPPAKPQKGRKRKPAKPVKPFKPRSVNFSLSGLTEDDILNLHRGVATLAAPIIARREEEERQRKKKLLVDFMNDNGIECNPDTNPDHEAEFKKCSGL